MVAFWLMFGSGMYVWVLALVGSGLGVLCRFCCGGLDFRFLVVVWAVVMAVWAALVAVQFGLGAGIMQSDGEGQIQGMSMGTTLANLSPLAVPTS